MPQTEVLLYAESDGCCPILEWLDNLPEKLQDKCIVRIERLSELGHELRRPEADFLRDGIYELRIPFQGNQYRILYFFYNKQAVISHGLMKRENVPDTEIEIAMKNKIRFEKDPAKHTYEE